MIFTGDFIISKDYFISKTSKNYEFKIENV